MRTTKSTLAIARPPLNVNRTPLANSTHASTRIPTASVSGAMRKTVASTALAAAHGPAKIRLSRRSGRVRGERPRSGKKAHRVDEQDFLEEEQVASHRRYRYATQIGMNDHEVQRDTKRTRRRPHDAGGESATEGRPRRSLAESPRRAQPGTRSLEEHQRRQRTDVEPPAYAHVDRPFPAVERSLLSQNQQVMRHNNQHRHAWDQPLGKAGPRIPPNEDVLRGHQE